MLKKCPAQRQQMRDVLVYPDKGRLRPEEQAFVDLLHKEAASTVKIKGAFPAKARQRLLLLKLTKKTNKWMQNRAKMSARFYFC